MADGAVECGELECDGAEFATIVEVGSGVGEIATVGEALGSGAADGVDTGVSTVPIMGLSKSSANERGETIKTQRTTRANIALFIDVSGDLATTPRVMKVAIFNFFGRVLTEQIDELLHGACYP